MAYDLIVVGGGIAGASLAQRMAKSGARVLVLEQETEFRDRIRGECLQPWGVGEAHQLGVADVLRTCANEMRWVQFIINGQHAMRRDFVQRRRRLPGCGPSIIRARKRPCSRRRRPPEQKFAAVRPLSVSTLEPSRKPKLPSLVEPARWKRGSWRFALAVIRHCARSSVSKPAADLSRCSSPESG